MKRLLICNAFLLILFVLFSFSVVADGSCESKCKYGPYSACLGDGTAEDVCYKIAFQPCAEQCPHDDMVVGVATPVSIAPAPSRQSCPDACMKRFEGDKLAILKCVEVECGIAPKPMPPVPLPPVMECPPREHECEMGCVKSYSDCSQKAKFFKGDEYAKFKMNCRDDIGACLDACGSPAAPKPVPRPAATGPMPCDLRCAFIQKECFDAGVDEASCAMKAKDCVTHCAPQSVEKVVAEAGMVAPAGAAETAEASSAAEAAEENPVEKASEKPAGFWSRMMQKFFG